VRAGLLILGTAVLAALFWTVGWPAVSQNLERIGGWLVVVVALFALPEAAFILGWRQVLSPRPRLSALPGLAAAFLAGDTANYVGAGVAGEPLRALLIRKSYGSAAAFASINLRKHAELAAQVAFLLAGVGFALVAYRLPDLVALAAAGGVLVITAGLVLMTWALRRGSYSPILRRLAGWKALASRLSRLHEGAADVDAALHRFYRENGARFAASAAFAFAAWCGGWIETWLILKLLGVGAGWGQALAIETLTMTLNTMLMFIPGRLGSAEAVRVGVFVALGLPAAPGVAYALVRRARELFWTLPGAIVLFRRHATALLSPGAREGAGLSAAEVIR
jgi:uncharacterized protein (TIRG00374 family)